jgi:type IV secretory pathway component VirB8
MSPDEDLLSAIDSMASTRQATGNAIGFYLDEWDRRQSAKLNRLLVRLTWGIAGLTAAVLIVAVVTLVVALRG